jgi:DNA-binding CsgD family transcriptional regulator
MTAKPCFGHPSRSAAVLAFRLANMTTRQIAEKIGIAESTVTALEHSALRSTKRAARPAEEHGRTILFPRDLLERLGPHAARRCINPNSLARLIVETVVDEGLIDNVLDDEGVNYV